MKYEDIRISNIKCKDNEYFNSEEIYKIMTKYIDNKIKEHIELVNYNPDEIIKMVYTSIISPLNPFGEDDILVKGSIGDEEIESWIEYKIIYELSLIPEIRNKKLNDLGL
jgi:hypothetical protein